MIGLTMPIFNIART